MASSWSEEVTIEAAVRKHRVESKGTQPASLMEAEAESDSFLAGLLQFGGFSSSSSGGHTDDTLLRRSYCLIWSESYDCMLCRSSSSSSSSSSWGHEFFEAVPEAEVGNGRKASGKGYGTSSYSMRADEGNSSGGELGVELMWLEKRCERSGREGVVSSWAALGPLPLPARSPASRPFADRWWRGRSRSLHREMKSTSGKDEPAQGVSPTALSLSCIVFGSMMIRLVDNYNDYVCSSTILLSSRYHSTQQASLVAKPKLAFHLRAFLPSLRNIVSNLYQEPFLVFLMRTGELEAAVYFEHHGTFYVSSSCQH